MLAKMAWLALAGACGTISRFAVYELAAKSRASHLPLGTFAVNILGSLLFGFVYSVAQSRINVSDQTRMILLTGFMGAFTTFSTFAFETARMLRSEQWTLALFNVMGQVVLGTAALALGVILGRQTAP